MNESKRTKLTNEQHSFLRDLMRWQGVASSQDLAPQLSQADNSARQTCKRRGWVTFDGPGDSTKERALLLSKSPAEGGEM